MANHLRCTCGRAFAHIGDLLDHRAAEHFEPQWAIVYPSGAARPDPPEPIEPGPPCTSCGSRWGRRRMSDRRPWRSSRGQCSACYDGAREPSWRPRAQH